MARVMGRGDALPDDRDVGKAGEVPWRLDGDSGDDYVGYGACGSRLSDLEGESDHDEVAAWFCQEVPWWTT